MDRIFAIGDIHGCFDKLIALINKVDINFERDTLVFLGDYIDRGPSSYEVVDLMIKLKRNYRKIVFLKGNHEEMLLNFISGVDRYMYLVNGGQQTIDSYMGKKAKADSSPFPLEHMDFFKSLELMYETDNFVFVHAGLKDKVPLEKQKPEDLLWMRKNFIKSKYDFGKRVVFGHTPCKEPLIKPNKIGLDTGAVFGGRLTCVELTGMKFYSV